MIHGPHQQWTLDPRIASLLLCEQLLIEDELMDVCTNEKHASVAESHSKARTHQIWPQTRKEQAVRIPLLSVCIESVFGTLGVDCTSVRMRKWLNISVRQSFHTPKLTHMRTCF